MCDVAARCPACGTDLAAYETEHGDLPFGQRHHFECPCGVGVTITEPAPGLIMTRQDAEIKD